ncbi:MAG: hypothetical protein V2A76_09310, partial [Planctomycetota bacterium]
REAAAPELMLDARIQTDSELSAPILAQAMGWATYPSMAGDVAVLLGLELGKGRSAATLEVDSDDFDLRFDPTPSEAGAAYGFRARPLKASFRAEWTPAGPLDSLTGSGTLTAAACSFGRDNLEDLDLEGRFIDRSLRLEPVSAKTPLGGEVRGTATFLFPAAGSRSIRADVRGRNLEFTPFTTRLSALCAPVFAFQEYPWNLTSTTRIDGHLQLAATGAGLHDFLRSVRGTGELAFSAGTVSGSPLLDWLIPPRGTPGARSLAGGDSRFVAQDGRFDIDANFRWPSHELSLRGQASTNGQIDYLLPPTCLFDDVFLREHGAEIPTGCLRIRGSVSSPEIQLPDPEEWIKAAREGELSEAINRLISR